MIYLYIGFNAFNIERKSKINRLFFAFCLSMAVWSFAYAFVYVTDENQYIWMKISAIGWCTFSSFILHLVLLFTENKIIKSAITKTLIYIPSAIFFYISVFLFWKDAKPPVLIEKFFYIGDFIYHFSFLLVSIIVVTIWGIKSENRRQRKQSRIIAVSSIIPFLLNLLTQTILPAFGMAILPLMGHIYSLLMVIGVYYAMIKYRLFVITPKLLVEELLQEMMDIVVLVSAEGKIIRINNYTEKLLGYTFDELAGRDLDIILHEDIVDEICDVKNKVEIHRLSEVFCKKKDGSKIPVSLSSSPVIDPFMDDIISFVIVGQDISVVKRLEKEISDNKDAQKRILHLAYHDSLTGLPNRKYFYEVLNKAIDDENSEEKGFAVLFLDLDDLKYINDSFGHEAGDNVLCEVGKRMSGSISSTDIAARIGGDEFTLLMFGISDSHEAKIAAKNILDSVSKPVHICGKDITISASIGFSIFHHDGKDVDLLVKKADNEMYSEKRKKKQNRIYF